MKISLIMATLGREVEVEVFLNSLSRQTMQDFELIVVDQNNHDKVKNLCDQYQKKIPIKYIHSNIKGLSHARNIGLQKVTGDIVGFPDDDCWYDDTTLELVEKTFRKQDYDGITGTPIDKFGGVLINNFLKNDAYLNLQNVWHGGISYTIFLKSTICNRIGIFDEDLGVGANTLFGSAEETDYLIRCLNIDSKIYYMKKLRVYHPRKNSLGTSDDIKRAKLYGYGLGAVLKKHSYPVSYVLKTFIRPLLGSIIALCLGNVALGQFRYNTFRGRLFGWLSYKKQGEL